MERATTEVWIMLVEGNLDDSLLVERALRRACRSEELRTFTSAAEAWSVLTEIPDLPCLVLLANRLHGMSSLEFVACLRNSSKTKGLPVVVLSGEWEPQGISEALNAGVNSLVIKATDFDRYMENLKSTLHYWLEVHCGTGSPSIAAETL